MNTNEILDYLKQEQINAEARLDMIKNLLSGFKPSSVFSYDEDMKNHILVKLRRDKMEFDTTHRTIYRNYHNARLQQTNEMIKFILENWRD